MEDRFVVKVKANFKMDHYLKIAQASLQKLYRSRVFFGIELIISSLLGIFLVFPVLAFAILVNEIVRSCVKVGLWFLYGDKIQLSQDEIGSNYSAVDEKENVHTILYLGELEGPVDVNTVRKNFQKNVIENKAYSRLRSIWIEKWFYVCMKKCDNFDIANHIRAYPGTESRTVSETELLQKILPELSQDMTDLEKPQWELVIVPYYSGGEDEGRTKALKIIRIHHSYMDGASTLIMIANTFSGEGESFPYVINPCKPLNISRASMILYKLTSLALFSTAMIKNVVRPPFTRYSRFSLKGKPGKDIFGWTNKIPIDFFQNIKEHSGVSMPAITSTVISGALRSLEMTYPDKNNIGGKTVQPLWLVAGMFPYSADNPCNNHVGIESIIDTSDMSGVKRLSLMNDELGRLARNPAVNVFYWDALLMGRAPKMITKLFLKFAACPIILSNIPLSTRNIKMWGNECTGIVGWVPLIVRTGLGIVSVRYANYFRYCIHADSNVMSQEELDLFVSLLEQQVEELCWETSQLKRKISTDTSLFRRVNGDRKKSVAETSLPEINENENNNTYKANYESCANNEKQAGLAGYSIIYKVRDIIDQIKDGIGKIKEQ